MIVFRRQSYRWLVLAGTIALQTMSACGRFNGRTAPPVDPSPWPTVLTTSRQLASESRFGAADSMLVDFATHHPGTSEARETAYWRALYNMDPDNHHASEAAAMAWLDAYLADSGRRDHVVEATILRRIGRQVDGLNKLAASAVAEAKDANAMATVAKTQAADAKALAEAPSLAADAEIRRLKDDLAKATAELERIRKRLSQPPPRKP